MKKMIPDFEFKEWLLLLPLVIKPLKMLFDLFKSKETKVEIKPKESRAVYEVHNHYYFYGNNCTITTTVDNSKHESGSNSP